MARAKETPQAEPEAKARREPSEFAQHMNAAGKSIVQQWASIIPREFWQHRREARREMLLATRALVDAAIKRIEGKMG